MGYRQGLRRVRPLLSVLVVSWTIWFWTASPASAATWSRQPTPNPFAQQNVLYGVDCVSASWCMGVGYGINSGSPRAFAARWNGSSWRAVNPGTASSLQEVACPSTSTCFAVGQRVALSTGRRLPALLKWNGTGWTSVAVSAPAGQQYAILNGVDCRTATSCLAVGGSSDGSGSPFHTLVYRYSGAGWSRVISPNPSAAPVGNTFAAVSCTGASNCYVAGNAGTKTLVEHWRGGSTWHRLSTPNPRAANNFRAITCTSGTSCFAVGDTMSSTGVSSAFAEHYNGTSWSTRTFTAADSFLDDVSCVSASVCVAVGAAAPHTMAVEYTAGGWRSRSTPDPGVYNYLYGVGCGGPTCEAVGAYTTATSNSRSLAARYS